jgi:hypothetical protein
MNEHIQQKSWFSRNWMWVVPTGGCLLIILLFVFGIGAAIFGVSKIFTGSAPYEYAVEQASKDSRVIEQLGNPVETAGIMQGNISIKNDSGKVDIKIPLKGPKGKGSVTIKGDKIDSEWVYEELYVLIKETNEKINLLDKVLEGV